MGTPILTGPLIRIALGIWADQCGGRLVLTVTMLAAAVATFFLSYAHTYAETLVAALGVGVGIAYVSRWYSMEKQRVALGAFGVGNVGAAVTKFVAPLWLADGGAALAWLKPGSELASCPIRSSPSRDQSAGPGPRARSSRS